MGQEFFINSDTLETKVNQLLPSSGGRGAGFDLSASTQIVPIVDLTESAEGAQVRQDIQTAFSFNDITTFQFENNSGTILNNTGYFRVFGAISFKTTSGVVILELNDGASDKTLLRFDQDGTSNQSTQLKLFDIIVFLPAGHSLKGSSDANNAYLRGVTKQIADIDGNLTNPS
tara:strand:- start:154 stop:672 length:519 start_codon:yes stop_codon:yes gene_type:complete